MQLSLQFPLFARHGQRKTKTENSVANTQHRHTHTRTHSHRLNRSIKEMWYVDNVLFSNILRSNYGCYVDIVHGTLEKNKKIKKRWRERENKWFEWPVIQLERLSATKERSIGHWCVAMPLPLPPPPPPPQTTNILRLLSHSKFQRAAHKFSIGSDWIGSQKNSRDGKQRE